MADLNQIEATLTAAAAMRSELAPIAKIGLAVIEDSRIRIAKAEQAAVDSEMERDEMAERLAKAEARADAAERMAQDEIAKRTEILITAKQAVTKARAAAQEEIQQDRIAKVEAELLGARVAKAVSEHPDVQALLFLKKCTRHVVDGRDMLANKSIGPWEVMTPTGNVIAETRADCIEIARSVVKFLAEKEMPSPNKKPPMYPEVGSEMGSNDTYDSKSGGRLDGRKLKKQAIRKSRLL